MDDEQRREEVQRLVSAMTNWQRNQWAKAGYPGLRAKQPKAVKPFLDRIRISRPQ